MQPTDVLAFVRFNQGTGSCASQSSRVHYQHLSRDVSFPVYINATQQYFSLHGRGSGYRAIVLIVAQETSSWCGYLINSYYWRIWQERDSTYGSTVDGRKIETAAEIAAASLIWRDRQRAAVCARIITLLISELPTLEKSWRQPWKKYHAESKRELSRSWNVTSGI